MPQNELLQAAPVKATGIRPFFAGIFLLAAYLLAINVPQALGRDLPFIYQAPVFFIGLAGLLATGCGLFQAVRFAAVTRSIRALAIQLAVVAAFSGACYLGVAWREGSPLPGDQMLALLGKPRNDPAVQAAIRRLGPECTEWDESQTVVNVKLADPHECLSWGGHNLTLKFDGNNVLIAVEFGGILHFCTYDGAMPYGLAANDLQQAVLAKIGPPDAKRKGSRENTVNWLYQAKHLLIEWDGAVIGKICLALPGS